MKTTNDQWAVLAALRFFLAGIVLACHAAQYAPMPRAVTEFAQMSGLGAVVGFLIVSGYSIGHSYGQKPEGFYGRRIDRIYPLYFVAFLLALIPLALAYTEAPSPLSLIGNAFLLQGTLAARLVALGPAWTLAIECLCYLLTPLFAKMPNKVLLALVAASLACFALHGRITPLYFSEMRWGLGFACLLWPWLLGFVFVRNSDAAWSKMLLLLLPLTALSLLPADGPYAALTVGLSATLVLFAGQIKVPFAGALKYAGEISYPLYIFHYPVLVLLAGAGVSRWGLSLILPLAASVIAYHAIDLPYRRYAKRSARARELRKTLSDAPAPAPA